eukprot:2586427-Amphidinium_carterae.1
MAWISIQPQQRGSACRLHSAIAGGAQSRSWSSKGGQDNMQVQRGRGTAGPLTEEVKKGRLKAKGK